MATERRILAQLDQPPPPGRTRWNGRLLAQALGDGIFALFGAPYWISGYAGDAGIGNVRRVLAFDMHLFVIHHDVGLDADTLQLRLLPWLPLLPWDNQEQAATL